MSFKDYFYELSEGVNDPAIFKAVFLAGGPGSGKSFIVKRTALQAMGFVLINSDIAFENLMRKKGLDFKMPDSEKEQRDIVRDMAKATIDQKLKLALQGRLGVIIDGTGKDFAKIDSARRNLASLGYECGMIFVNTDLDTAKKRNAQRTRSVKDELVTKMWKEVQSNLGKFHQTFGNNFYLVDNSEGHDFDSQVTSVFKKISAWSRTPSANAEARKWIASQRHGISEDVLPSKLKKAKDKKESSKKSDSKGAPTSFSSVFAQGATGSGFGLDAGVSPAGATAWGTGVTEDKEMKDDPCWKGYQMVGFKKKKGKKVPNCVPQNEESEITENVTDRQVNKLKSQWDNVDNLDTNSAEWQTVKNYLQHLSTVDLHTIVMAKIKFVSPYANTVYAKRAMRSMGQSTGEDQTI